MAERDMKYERDLFYRFEQAVVDGKPISKHVVFSDTPLWHRFAQSLFDGDIKQFAKTQNYKTYKEEVSVFKKTRVSALLISLIVFVVNILAVLALFIFRQKVLVFSVDKVSDKKTGGDFRLTGLYELLEDRSFIECFHTKVGKKTLTNMFSRRRIAIYLEGIDELWYIARFFKKKPSFEIKNLTGTEDEVAFMQYTITKFFALRDLLEFRKSVLSFILKYSGVRLVIGIDDVRHYHELLEAARDNGIKSVLLQHGHFTKYHLGWLSSDAYKNMRYVKADTLFVWSEYWKDELLRLDSVYKEEDIKVSGYPEKKANILFADSIDQKVVLIPHETEAPVVEVYEYIKACADCGARVYLKVRPDYSIEEQLSEYPDNVTDYAEVVCSLSTVPRPSMVLGVYSTFLYDMGLLGVPVGIMETSMDYGEGMVINDMARKVKLHKVCDALKEEGLSPKGRLSTKASFNEVIGAQLKDI